MLRSDVDRLRDAVPLEVGLPTRSSGAFLLSEALRANGLAWQEAVLSELAFADAVETDGSARPAILVSRDPWMRILQRQSYRSVWDASQLQTGYYSVLAVRPSALATSADTLDQFLALESEYRAKTSAGLNRAEEAMLYRHRGLSREDGSRVLEEARWIDPAAGRSLLEDLESPFWQHGRDVFDFLKGTEGVGMGWDPESWVYQSNAAR